MGNIKLLQLLGLFLSLLLVNVCSRETRQIEISPGVGYEVVYKRVIKFPWYNKPLRISSSLPVVLHRFTNETLHGNELVYKNEVYMFIKTTCPTELGAKVRIKETIRGRSWVTEEAKKVRILTKVQPKNITVSESTFAASWRGLDCDEGIGRHNADAIEKNMLTNARPLNTDNEEECNAVVEVIYDGCQRIAKVNAPAVKLVDSTLDITEKNLSDDSCEIYYHANMRDDAKAEQVSKSILNIASFEGCSN